MLLGGGDLRLFLIVFSSRVVVCRCVVVVRRRMMVGGGQEVMVGGGVLGRLCHVLLSSARGGRSGLRFRRKGYQLDAKLTATVGAPERSRLCDELLPSRASSLVLFREHIAF